MSIAELRKRYHAQLCETIIRVATNKQGKAYPNLADAGNPSSIAIAWGIVNRINYASNTDVLAGQTAGASFEQITRDFLEAAFKLIEHLRPGRWHYATHKDISHFDQYAHLASVEQIIKESPELQTALGGDYIITPDIVVGKWPVSDAEINVHQQVLEAGAPEASSTPLREANQAKPRMTLHASISCKWTLRSDRSQNARTEALNLIRNRKGRLPHIAVVTAEPTPWRIASIALGTGDLDCVYHFALYELIAAVAEQGNPDNTAQLEHLVQGQRLRDISDLPFDLAV